MCSGRRRVLWEGMKKEIFKKVMYTNVCAACIIGRTLILHLKISSWSRMIYDYLYFLCSIGVLVGGWMMVVLVVVYFKIQTYII